MKRQFSLALAIATAMSVAGFAFSASAQDRTGQFAQLDKNGDGYVSLDEVPAELRAKFERLLKLAGKEQDMRLNRALFEGAAKADKTPIGTAQPSGDLFAQLDANRDGIVSEDEVGQGQREAFGRLLKNGDIDGDGKLSRDEYAASTKATETPRQPGRGGVPAGPGRPGIGGGPPIDPAQLFARLDRNGDEKLSKEEAPPRMQENFDRIDANGDGGISRGEFERVSGQFPGMFGRPPGAGGPPGMPPAGLFALFDLDRDGELSTSEIVAAGSTLLKLDKNSDGKLTPDEVFAGPRPPRP